MKGDPGTFVGHPPLCTCDGSIGFDLSVICVCVCVFSC